MSRHRNPLDAKHTHWLTYISLSCGKNPIFGHPIFLLCNVLNVLKARRLMFTNKQYKIVCRYKMNNLATEIASSASNCVRSILDNLSIVNILLKQVKKGYGLGPIPWSDYLPGGPPQGRRRRRSCAPCCKSHRPTTHYSSHNQHSKSCGQHKYSPAR